MDIGLYLGAGTVDSSGRFDGTVDAAYELPEATSLAEAEALVQQEAQRFARCGGDFVGLKVLAFDCGGDGSVLTYAAVPSLLLAVA